MRKAISLLIATSLVFVTLWFSYPPSSAQKFDKPKPTRDHLLDKAIQKHWERLPPQMKGMEYAEAKAAWEKLTPKQHAMLRAKVQELLTSEADKYAKDKEAARASLKTWNDVIQREAPNSGEDETLLFKDATGKSRAVKAKRRDGSLRPNARVADGPIGLQKGPKPVWEGNWAFGQGQQAMKAKSHHARRAAAGPLAPQPGCSRGPEQYVRTFFGGLFSGTSYEGALARPPSPSELSSWLNTLAQAQAQGTQVTAAQNLAYAVFQSPEYASRGRSNRDFVYDCYVAFLQRGPDQPGWDFWTAQADAHGQAAVLPGFGLSIEFYNVVNSLCNVSSFDGDQDGLPDSFENTLADSFTPEYHVSYNEPDSYATMQDFVPQTLKRTFGLSPVSHFRVTPVTITTNPHNGQLQSYLRIDYLTLWNQDSGLVDGLGCSFALAPFAGGMESHPLDDERSALLVSAPAPNPYTYNNDPNAYQSLSIYTAAHEGTFGDQSMYHDYPTTPVPAGSHVPLWQSQSKHGTYTFDPDFHPILEASFQVIILAAIYLIGAGFCGGWYPGDPWWEDFGFLLECDFWWSVAYYEAVLIVYTCAVERFHAGGTQGLVSLASTRINVGEPAHPINGSTFIQDNSEAAFHLRDKLETPLRFEVQIP